MAKALGGGRIGKQRFRTAHAVRPAAAAATAAAATAPAAPPKQQPNHAIARAAFEKHAGSDEFIDRDELRAMCSGMGRELSSADLDAVFARLDADDSGIISFDEYLIWWDVGLCVESLLKLAVVQAPASSTDDRAALQASAQKRRKQRKQSLVEGLAVGGDSPYKKDRPGRTSERQLPARGGGAEGTASDPASVVAPLPVARRMTQGALDAAAAAARGGPSAPQEHAYNAPENQLENYLGGGALEDLEA